MSKKVNRYGKKKGGKGFRLPRIMMREKKEGKRKTAMEMGIPKIVYSKALQSPPKYEGPPREYPTMEDVPHKMFLITDDDVPWIVELKNWAVRRYHSPMYPLLRYEGETLNSFPDAERALRILYSQSRNPEKYRLLLARMAHLPWKEQLGKILKASSADTSMSSKTLEERKFQRKQPKKYKRPSEDDEDIIRTFLG